MEHRPDPRRKGELMVDGRRVRLRLDGKELEPTEPSGTHTEAKPKPPTPDDPRPNAWLNLGGPYVNP